MTDVDYRLRRWAEWARKHSEVRGYPSSTLEHSVIHGKGASQDTQGYIDPDIEEVEKVVRKLPDELLYIVKIRYLSSFNQTDQVILFSKRYGEISSSTYKIRVQHMLHRVDQGLRVIE